MVAITMMALALSEDSIARRSKRDAIIDGLGHMPDTIREVCTDQAGHKHVQDFWHAFTDCCSKSVLSSGRLAAHVLVGQTWSAINLHPQPGTPGVYGLAHMQLLLS